VPTRGGSTNRLVSETSGFDQTNLVATCCEFKALVALNDHATAGLDPDDPSPHPAKGSGFEHLDHITGL
jgi:hypothetical protein